MIVIRFDPEENDLFHSYESVENFLSGGVSSGWMEPVERPQRRIGFQMRRPPSEAELDDEEWRLP